MSRRERGDPAAGAKMRRGDLATTTLAILGGGAAITSQQPSTLSDASIDCSKVIGPTLDGHPVRSPQIVHTALLPVFHDKDIVEFGTRSGDGMCCFAMAARSARAFESDPRYCSKLKKRLPAFRNATGVTFDVWCMRYQRALDNGDLRDADVFTWWFGGNGLDSSTLAHLRMTYDAGRLRRGASAVVLFEADSKDDQVSYEALRNHSTWARHIAFNETLECRRHYKYKPWLCDRSHGSYHILGFRLADVPLTVGEADPYAKMDNKTLRYRERAVG